MLRGEGAPRFERRIEAQPGKSSAGRSTAALLDARSRIPPAERVAELSRRAFGSAGGPDPAFRAAGAESG